VFQCLQHNNVSMIAISQCYYHLLNIWSYHHRPMMPCIPCALFKILPCVLFITLSHVLKYAFGKFIFIQSIQILFKFYMIIYIYILNLQIYFQHQLSLPLPSRQIPSDYPCNGSFVTLFAIKHEVFLRHNVDHIYEKKEEF
jgi:hypothetical protein